MSIFSRLFGKSSPNPEPPEDSDDAILQTLAESGVDLTRELPIDFFLYFPGVKEARHALKDALHAGYEGELHDPPSEDLDWLIVLRRRMIATRQGVKDERARLDALAAAHDGEFEGWDAADNA